MSLTTWKQEFYTTPATTPQDKLSAIEHSLKKWRGLTKENLERHQVAKNNKFIFDIKDKTDALLIAGSSCALCCLYYLDGCEGCPLYRSLGNIECDGHNYCFLLILLST